MALERLAVGADAEAVALAGHHDHPDAVVVLGLCSAHRYSVCIRPVQALWRWGRRRVIRPTGPSTSRLMVFSSTSATYAAAMDLELLASGYGLIEGPRVDPEGNLYFSDVPNGGVHRRSPDGEITVAVPKRRGVGGIAIHADGGLVLSGRNICHVRDGETRILYEDPTALGYNDLFCDDEGRVFVGVLRSNPFELGGTEPATGELVRVDSEGDGTVLYGEVGVSNGIGISPDRSTLYHADTNARGLIVHDLAGDGSVSNRRLLPCPTCPTVSPSTPRAASGWRATPAGASSATCPTALPTSPSRSLRRW